MTESKFGAASSELMPGARNAVETCLAIAAGEAVALIADEPSCEVAASLEAALQHAGARCDSILIEHVATRPLPHAPREVLDALDRANAGILCVQPRQGELTSRMEIVAVVERRSMRYAHMVGVTPEIMRQGMRADYRRVDALSQRLCERMREADTLHVETPSGTSFTAAFDRSLAWVKTSGLISTRYWSNLPAGEVFTTPASVDGTFVCNGTAGDYFGPKYGDLQATPLTLQISGGRLTAARCERRDPRDRGPTANRRHVARLGRPLRHRLLVARRRRPRRGRGPRRERSTWPGPYSAAGPANEQSLRSIA